MYLRCRPKPLPAACRQPFYAFTNNLKYFHKNVNICAMPWQARQPVQQANSLQSSPVAVAVAVAVTIKANNSQKAFKPKVADDIVNKAALRFHAIYSE